MGYPNLLKYVEFETAIKKVGVDRLKSFIISKGHRADKLDRNFRIIKYTMQHGPSAASKVFHVASSYPSNLLYLYGRYAKELSEIIDMEKK